MDHIESEMMGDQRIMPTDPQLVPTDVVRQGYRRPRIVTIGTATELVQQNSSGRDMDGSGGWYVWGS